jgi:hypothetical protein
MSAPMRGGLTRLVSQYSARQRIDAERTCRQLLSSVVKVSCAPPVIGAPLFPMLTRKQVTDRAVLFVLFRRFNVEVVPTEGVRQNAGRAHRLSRLLGEAMPFPRRPVQLGLIIHTAHTTWRHARCTLGLRPVADHGLGGDQ